MSLVNRWRLLSAGFVVAVALAACGGKPTPTAAPVLIGQFLDGPVEGLGFRTATGTGFTDARGQFTYRAGESVTFFIGDVVLPAVPAAAVLTPLDVVGTNNLNDPKVVNLLVLLQSLGDRGGTPDRIQISQAARMAASSASGRALGEALRN